MQKVKNKTLIYNWMPDSCNNVNFKNNKNYKKQVLAVVANFLPYKGHDLFLEAMSDFDKSVLSNVEIRFYGLGELEQKLRLKAQKLKLKVKFMGFKIMTKEYPEIDCVIIPSLKPEAFSLVIGEAWANGVTVLASDIGAHLELINDNISGYLFKSDDISSLKDKILYFLNSSTDVRELIINKAKTESLKYDVKIFEKKMTEILEL